MVMDVSGNQFFTGSGKQFADVTRSLLFPGFHYQINSGKFEYYWRIRGYGATHLVLPLKDGTKVVAGTDGYDIKKHGKLAKPWVLFFFAESDMPFDYPMLFCLSMQPKKIEVWTHEYLKIIFSQKKAAVVQVHPFGSQKLDKKETVKWSPKFPGEHVKLMDFWAGAAMAYPSACSESFCVDEKSGTRMAIQTDDRTC